MRPSSGGRAAAHRDEPDEGGTLHEQPLHHAERLTDQPPAPQRESRGQHAVRRPGGVELGDGQLGVRGVVEDLEHDRARALVEPLGGEPAEVVGDAVPDVRLEQPLPPRARAGVRASKSSSTSSYWRTAATGSPPISVMRARTRSRRSTAADGEPAELEALLDGGGERGVRGEPREGDVLELRDETEELDRVGVLQRSRPAGIGLRARASSSSEDRSRPDRRRRPACRGRRIDWAGNSVARSSRNPRSFDDQTHLAQPRTRPDDARESTCTIGCRPTRVVNSAVARDAPTPVGPGSARHTTLRSEESS